MKIAAPFFILLLMLVTSHAKDVPGAKDHPLIGRYQGSEIGFYQTNAFDEAWLLKAPLDYGAILAKTVGEHGGGEWLRLQGRITQIRYDTPAGRSSLEIMANLRSSLAAKGVPDDLLAKEAGKLVRRQGNFWPKRLCCVRRFLLLR